MLNLFFVSKILFATTAEFIAIKERCMGEVVSAKTLFCK